METARTRLTETEARAISHFAESVRGDQQNNLLEMRLFGSKARGQGHPESDVDILVVVRNKSVQTGRRISEIAWKFEWDSDVPLAPIVLSENEMRLNRTHHTLFAENIEKDGIKL